MGKLTQPPQDGFKITQRHYDIILKQGRDLLPIEAGGFLGGTDGIIKAILPIYNQHLEVQTDTFGFTMQDMERALRFFDDHSLDYIAMYHTHPKGIAYPSQTDIDTGHTFHFILSLKNPDQPDFRAYYIQNKKPIAIPFKVLADKGFSKKDLGGKQDIDTSSQATLNQQESAQDLAEKLDQIRNPNNKQSPYQRYDSFDPNSDFSTLA